MIDKKTQQKLITHLTDLDESYVLELVKQLLAEGRDPLSIIKTCEQAMALVGDRYEKREYYLSALIMAGEIFREVMAMSQPLMEKQLTGSATGRILLGTVQRDIHNIGKGIVDIALKCYGFTVIDLGVDVPPHRFVEEALANPPDVIGLSGLITTAYEGMQETIQLLRSSTPPGQPPIPVIIGGGMLNNKVCQLVGADYWTADAMEGVRICQKIVDKNRGLQAH